jgi:hypothetical protein
MPRRKLQRAAALAVLAAVIAAIRENRTRQDRPRAVFRPLPISRVPPGRKTAHRASQGVPPRSRAPLSDRDITAAIRALPADDVAALLGDRGRAKLLAAARLAKRARGGDGRPMAGRRPGRNLSA